MGDLMKPVDPPSKAKAPRPWYKKKRFMIPAVGVGLLFLLVVFSGGNGVLEAELAQANEALDERTAELEASLAAQTDLEAQVEQLDGQLEELNETVAQLEERISEQEALEQEIAELHEQHQGVLARLLLEIGDDLQAAVEQEIARACAAAVEQGDPDAGATVEYDSDWDYVTDERAVGRSATECAEEELARIAEEEAEQQRQEEEAEAQRQREEEERRQQEEEAQREQEATEAETSRDQGVVHPGAFCSPEGATGVTSAGTPMECKTTPEDSRARWRQR